MLDPHGNPAAEPAGPIGLQRLHFPLRVGKEWTQHIEPAPGAGIRSRYFIR